MNTLRNKSINKLLILLLSSPLVSFGQTFELFDGQSMCMIGKGQGQDATNNPYSDEDYSYALIENIGSVEFQIRIESSKKHKTVLIQSKNIVVIKLIKNDVLYFDALTSEKARAKIKYTIDDGELPPPHRPKSSAYPLH